MIESLGMMLSWYGRYGLSFFNYKGDWIGPQI
jgi:hypothetical protein